MSIIISYDIDCAADDVFHYDLCFIFYFFNLKKGESPEHTTTLTSEKFFHSDVTELIVLKRYGLDLGCVLQYAHLHHKKKWFGLHAGYKTS